MSVVKLEELIPDPSTRAFLRAVRKEWGHDWAVTLAREISNGVLVDMGPVQNREISAAEGSRCFNRSDAAETLKQLKLEWK